MSKNNKADAAEVYSSMGFSELFSSPVFYSVLVLTIILGLSSAFGFLQNPRKLKLVVDVISHKVSLSRPHVVSQNEYLISQSMKSDKETTISNIDKNRYSIFSDSFNNSDLVISQGTSVKPVSFDYDITSREFWGDLDMTRIESAIEETQRQNRGSFTIGTPIELDSSIERNDSKYSMRAGLILSL